MQFSLASCYYIPLKFQMFSPTPVLKHPQSTFFPQDYTESCLLCITQLIIYNTTVTNVLVLQFCIYKLGKQLHKSVLIYFRAR
jgi:hypothetical protein